MSDTIIAVENLGKRYRISHRGEKQRYTALRDVIVEKANQLFERRGREAGNKEDPSFDLHNQPFEDFWALKDVCFEVKRGEVLGIIGRNGAGKSTLLKILSRITEPTEGRVTLQGRVASLLEVGTGFHPELTGRENVFLNGAILGMHRAEIKRKFDEIVAFAEVEKFLDTPVKRYSSGMYVRLAFAVAAHLEMEILIVDEVLAVGDAEFQKKCLGKMQAISKREGRTVLLVSHNFGLIRSFCERGIALNSGRLHFNGNAESAIESLAARSQPSALSDRKFEGPLLDSIRFTRILVNERDPLLEDVILSPRHPLVIETWYEVLKSFRGRITVSLFIEGTRILSGFDVSSHSELSQGMWRSRFEWPPHLLRPQYCTIAVGAYSGDKHGPYIWGSELAQFQVSAEWFEHFEERALGVIHYPPIALRERL